MAKDDSGFAEIEEYTKKLTQNPESLVFVPLAESYRKSGMLDEAIETCQKGLQVHPTYLSARIVLGRALMEKNLYAEAAAEFQKVAEADANNIMAHSLLGQLYLKQGKHSNAIEEYQKVLTINPDDANTQQLLKQALEQAKQAGTGKPDGNSGGGRSASDTRKEMSEAEALTKQGDIENAIRIYLLILEADPENLVVRQRLKDLELRKVQASTERKGGERPKTEAAGVHRDNDKITSDDILSVMKDTLPKQPDKAKAAKPETAKPEQAKTAEPKGKPHPAPVVEGSDLSETVRQALNKLRQTPGIVGLLLVDGDGKVLESSFKDRGNLGEMGKTAALILQKTGKAIQVMKYGQQVRQILITGEQGQIFFNKFGTRLLLVQADQNINIGKMRLAMNDVNKVLK